MYKRLFILLKKPFILLFSEQVKLLPFWGCDASSNNEGEQKPPKNQYTKQQIG